MDSPNKSDSVADSLLAPARAELEDRQQRLADRQASARRNIHSSLAPAWIASASAVAALDYLENSVYAIGIGAVIGWAFGEAIRRFAK